MVLMGWGGATTTSSVAGIFFVTGPLLLLLGTIFEWIAGNFLSMMICGFFCVFWGSFAPLQIPSYGIAASYSATGNAAEGAISAGYSAGLALYLLSMACAVFTLFIFTLKTNVVIASIFLLSTIGVSCLSAAYWNLSLGNFAKATQFQHVGGALLLALAILGWYMTFVMMVYEVGMPFNPPVGDLSRFWKRSSEDPEKQE
ncbi:hypothetical protein N7486_006006 [Penicillium sp. IBT 16267x]|nr:hypothetical protein N7486_006006 [Penicillium sp. IBT 16267x]